MLHVAADDLELLTFLLLSHMLGLQECMACPVSILSVIRKRFTQTLSCVNLGVYSGHKMPLVLLLLFLAML